MKQILIFLTIITLTSCQYLPKFSTPKSSDTTPEIETCPSTPNLILKSQDVETISFDEGKTQISGIAKKNQAIGYSFLAKKDQKLEIKTNDDICWWIYAPNNKLFTGKEIATDGKYIVQISTLKGSKTFSIDLELTTNIVNTPPPQPAILMLGTWEGYYNVNNATSQLFITHQSGNNFSGKIHTIASRGGTVIVNIEGEINPNSKEIVIRETDLVQTPNNNWILGVNNGTITSDFQTISGNGSDGTYKYSWSFTRH